MSKLYLSTLNLLVQLENELRQQQLLSTNPPSMAAMTSQTPFACDVMPLEQWLQYIFLPKMHSLIKVQAPLPTAMGIAPMAQHVWGNNLALKPLISLLTQLDELLCEPR